MACRIGRVTLTAFDLERCCLAPVRVLGLFLHDLPQDDRPLIGLHASLLEGRRLTVEPDSRQVWLEDR
jgi:hypothetical protein